MYVDQTTTFWVASRVGNDGTTATGAKDERDLENGQFHQNNGFWLVFDAYQNMTIETVKAYANGLGSRRMTLVDANGATLQSSRSTWRTARTSSTLNFFVPAGEGYGLRVSSDNPQLWRDGIGSDPELPLRPRRLRRHHRHQRQRRQQPELLLLLLRLDRCRSTPWAAPRSACP